MQESSSSIPNPHDHFFRDAMANKKVAQEFLKIHLPADLGKLVDFKHLELQPRDFISEVRKESIVDVLFKTTIAGHEAYLYLLIEHQSSPQRIMPFRILKYSCQAIDAHLKKYETDKIPLIYPMVVYHGKRPYNYSNDIKDLVDAPKELIDAYFLKPFQLIDVGKIEDETLKQYTWAGVMEFALKHIFERDVIPHLHNIREQLKKIDRPDGRDFLAIVLQYFIDRGETTDKKAFLEFIESNLSEEAGEKIMTIAEQFREEGLQQGKLETAKAMLKEGSDIAFIVKVTKLPLETIKNLKKYS